MNSTVVIGYDESPSSDLALAEAAREAAQRGASLTVVSAYAWPTSPTLVAARPADAEAVTRKASEQMADRGAAQVRSWYPDLRVETVAHPDTPWKALAAASEGAELLVVGNRGRGGFAELLLGSVSMRALVRAQCPVLVVRGGERAARRRVIAAVDLEDPGDAVLEFAFEEAARRSAWLEVTNVLHEPWSTAYLREGSDLAHDFTLIRDAHEADLTGRAQQVAAGHPGVRPLCRVAVGSAVGVLVADSELADLVVVGARRWDRRRRLRIGPVAEGLLHHARCSVAVVPFG